MNKRKKTLLILSTLLTLSVTACDQTEQTTQIANPFIKYETLAEAEQEIGFEISLPKNLDSYDEVICQVNKSLDMIEVIFKNEEDELRFRKAAGNDDISGDYNNYPEEKKVEINDISVTLKGENDKYSLAIWTKNEYSYSINIEQTCSQEMLETMISEFQ